MQPGPAADPGGNGGDVPGLEGVGVQERTSPRPGDAGDRMTGQSMGDHGWCDGVHHGHRPEPRDVPLGRPRPHTRPVPHAQLDDVDVSEVAHQPDVLNDKAGLLRTLMRRQHRGDREHPHEPNGTALRC